MERYYTENGPSKFARHFSQLIDGKAYVVHVLVEGLNCQIKSA